MASMKLLLAQTKPKKGDLKTNAAKIKEIVQGFSDVHVFIFPELFLSSYSSFHGPLAPDAPFITEDHPCLKELGEVSRQAGSYLIIGAPFGRKKSGGFELFNSALVLGPSGFVGTHDKTAIPDGRFGRDTFYEGVHFRPGERLSVFRAGRCSFGLLICYELFFPEVSRSLALSGAQLLICLSAAPLGQKRAFETMLPARAVENSAYLAFVNMPDEGGLNFFGGSALISPSGKTLASAKEIEEDLIMVEMDPAKVDKVRASYDNLKQALRVSKVATRVVDI